VDTFTQRKVKIKDDNLKFLGDQHTLLNWSGKTIEERAKLFHRAFPDTTLSSSTIRKVYRQLHIKKKRIALKKKIKLNGMIDERKKLEVIRRDLKKGQQKGRQIIFLDEVMFTFSTQQRADYSNLGTNIEVMADLLRCDTIAVVAAVSLDDGLVHRTLRLICKSIELYLLSI
jgi:hypothetical protein